MLIALSFFVFWIVFGPVGTFLSDHFKQLVELTFQFLFPPPVEVTGIITFVLHIFSRGVLPVVTILLGFLPQIFLIFLALELIKVFDLKLKTHILLAFGCTTLAVGSLDKENARASDIVLMSFIPCGAKLPIILTFAATLDLHFAIVFLIYAFCIIVGYLISLLWRKHNQTVEACKDCRKTFSIRLAISNTLQFLKRITGPVIILAPVLYILHEAGFLYHIANFVSPVFAPLGFGHPILVIALVFGFMGKELVFATLVTLAASMPALSTATMFSFVAFIVLSPPCISAMVAIRSKTTTAFAWKVFFATFTVAYVTSFVIYWLLALS